MSRKTRHSDLPTSIPALKDILRDYSDTEVMGYAMKLAKKNLKKGKSLTNKNDVVNALQCYLHAESREHVLVIFVDSANRILSTKTLFIGSVASVEINEREILRQALLENATGIFLAHNHPSGDPKPSDSDILVTQEIIKIARAIQIRVIDHVIVGTDGFYSFSDVGLL